MSVSSIQMFSKCAYHCAETHADFPRLWEAQKDRYVLDTTPLSSDRCHLFFFPDLYNEDFLIVAAFKQLCFPERNRHLASKFTYEDVGHKDVKIRWVQFSKEYRGVCERIAHRYKMIVGNSSILVGPKESWIVTIPPSAKIVSFYGPARYSTKELVLLTNEAIQFGQTNAEETLS